MIIQEELEHYLNNYLSVDLINDYAPNGLQIEGKKQINIIATAVTASHKAIEKAIKLKADALIVHHGYFWKGEPLVIRGLKKNRVQNILQNDINLFAYHLPLDTHLELGNNVLISKVLEIDAPFSHKVNGVDNLLWSGCISSPVTPQNFADFLEQKNLKPRVWIQGDKDREISKIGWCSGAAQDFLQEAYRFGVDAYISGEISERTYYEAKELGIHYFACGHYTTEEFGIKALGEHLSQQFNLQHHYINLDNPI